MVSLKAFQVDDETIYAALDAEQAAVFYEQDTGRHVKKSLITAAAVGLGPWPASAKGSTGASAPLKDRGSVA